MRRRESRASSSSRPIATVARRSTSRRRCRRLADTDLFAETMAWVQAHVDEPVTVEDLAQRSAMSRRTFARRFAASTGTTPYQWLLRQRLQRAQQLLETSGLSVDAVASRSGFQNAGNLRKHFSAALRTTPQAYRRAFRERREPPAARRLSVRSVTRERSHRVTKVLQLDPLRPTYRAWGPRRVRSRARPVTAHSRRAGDAPQHRSRFIPRWRPEHPSNVGQILVFAVGVVVCTTAPLLGLTDEEWLILGAVSAAMAARPRRELLRARGSRSGASGRWRSRSRSSWRSPRSASAAIGSAPPTAASSSCASPTPG